MNWEDFQNSKSWDQTYKDLNQSFEKYFRLKLNEIIHIMQVILV